ATPPSRGRSSPAPEPGGIFTVGGARGADERTQLERLDRGVRREPSPSGQPALPHHRYPPDRGGCGAVRRRSRRAIPVGTGGGAVRRRVGVPARGARLRAQAAGVLEGLALP